MLIISIKDKNKKRKQEDKLIYLIFGGVNMLDKLERRIELLSQSGNNTKQIVLEEMKNERFILREVFYE